MASQTRDVMRGFTAFGQYGVKRWQEPSQKVIGKAAVGAGGFAVAVPRHGGPEKFSNVYRVVALDRHAAAVASSRDVAVADPRAAETMLHNAFKTVAWDDASQAITGQHAPSNGAMCVADPRTDDRRSGAIGVVGWGETTGTVAGESLPSNGTFAVSDPRPNLRREKGDDWAGAGHYGVVQWTQNSGAVSSAAGYDNGRFSVAASRLPAATDRLAAVILSTDGTWHRPFTTLETRRPAEPGGSRRAARVGRAVRRRLA
jgi:hypothetical protein